MSIGFGTYRLNENTYTATKHAIHVGYTIIDTAPLYGNLEEVGRAIKDSNIFITTKISRESLEVLDIVGSINKIFKDNSISRRCLSLDVSCIANNECPPNKKKLSCVPTRSIESNSCQA